MHPNHPIRIVRRNRRTVASLLAFLAVLLALRAVRPATDGTAVVVAARPIAAGAVLAPADLSVRAFPPELVPAAASGDPASLVGLVSAVAVSSGEIFTATRLLSKALAADPGHPQNAPMPLRLADSQAAMLLRPGNRIDILAAPAASAAHTGGRARVVARDVLVLATPQKTASGDQLASTELGGSTAGALLLISASPDQAAILAGAEAVNRLTFVVH